MKLARGWLVLLGAAAATGAAFAQTTPLESDTVVAGQARVYRWNAQQTGYGFDPAIAPGFPTGKGLPSNQLPAITVQTTAGQSNGNGVTATNGGYLASPDLSWFFPLDIEGEQVTSNTTGTGTVTVGAEAPLGYFLDQVRSSPTIAGVTVSTGDLILTDFFGSTTRVDRSERNKLPEETLPSGATVPRRVNSAYLDATGQYVESQDPYGLYNGENTGCVYALDAFNGTLARQDFSGGLTQANRPFWWYGMRALPYYTADDDGVLVYEGTSTKVNFNSSPSEAVSDFFINASDTALRAFDYAPDAAVFPRSPFAKETVDQGIQRTISVQAPYLAPRPSLVAATTDATTGAVDLSVANALTAGAGPVTPGRADIPARPLDRTYNLSLNGTRFGLQANAANYGRSAVSGPLDNHFRSNAGMGPVNSTGAYVHLATPITYTSRYYKLGDDPVTVRRDPSAVSSDAALSTDQLYIVGSDDGTLYAFDALPTNARNVTTGASATLTNTNMGRLVWAFRAAARAPLYTVLGGTKGTTRVQATFDGIIGAGENQNAPLQRNGVNVHVGTGGTESGSDQDQLVAGSATVLSLPITSSPVDARVAIGATGNILSHKNDTVSVVFVGSSLGRLFAIDAETGEEIWEFKTTPLGQTIYTVGGNTVYVDSVQAQPITAAPSLGWLPTAVSAGRPTGAGRLAVFFSAADGKVYAVDAGDGTPIRPVDPATPGWNVPDTDMGGTAAKSPSTLPPSGDPGTRYDIDHYGFVTYPFESSAGTLPTTQVLGVNSLDASQNGYGRHTPVQAKALTAGVVLRPSADAPYTEPGTGRVIPAVDRAFITAPTNRNDAAVGADSARTGGTIYCVDPVTGHVLWQFDRWADVRRPQNTNFDKDPAGSGTSGGDYTVRPGGFNATPAFAASIQIYDDSGTGNTGHTGETAPLGDQSTGSDTRGVDVLFAVDAGGQLFALKTDDALTPDKRMYWRVPYSISGYESGTGVISSPVVSSPNVVEGNTGFASPSAVNGRSYVYIGIKSGAMAVDVTARRVESLTDAKGAVLASPNTYTGGEMSWSYTTPKETFTTGTSSTDSTVSVPVLGSVDEGVYTTPVVYGGYLYAGSDNGLVYAWANDATVAGGRDFSNSGGGGGSPFHGGNLPPIIPPPIITPPGGGQVVQGNFYVDIFKAGFDYSGNSAANPGAVRTFEATNIMGNPAGTVTAGGTESATNTIDPKPFALTETSFQTPLGAVLDWGDPVVVAAWGPSLANAPVDTGGAASGAAIGAEVEFHVTGPSVSGALYGARKAGQDTIHQVFYINPYGATLPNTILSTSTPSRYGLNGVDVPNPFAGRGLPPGRQFTVYGIYHQPAVSLSNGTTRGSVSLQSPQSTTKFILGNPIDVEGRYTPGPGISGIADYPVSAGGSPVDVEIYRNGNERVPVVSSVIGDHGTLSQMPQGIQDYTSIGDRSNLPRLFTQFGDTEAYLRVKVAPARLRWVGGAKAAYKPLIADYPSGTLPNGMPLKSTAPPEPLYAPDWRQQITSAYGGAYVYGSETPPFGQWLKSTYSKTSDGPGEENISTDYPDIQQNVQTWKAEPVGTGIGINATSIPGLALEQNATTNDVAIASTTPTSSWTSTHRRFVLQVDTPRYQPANFCPNDGTLNPVDSAGRGPGYYTINPLNDSANGGALLGWAQGAAKGAGTYVVSSDPTNGLTYSGALNLHVPATPSFAAQESTYLTRVYADINNNSNVDTDAEPFRQFVSGIQVRPNESIRVTTATIDIPQSPEVAIPGGTVPDQFYFDGQGAVVGASTTEEDSFLFGERNLYAPFSVYNNGNVNLWDLRMDKYDPYAGHLFAPDVDPNPFVGAAANSNWPGSGGLKRFNLASTLDALPSGGAGGPQDSSLWTPVPKPRPGGQGDEGQGRIIQVKNVFAFKENNGLPTDQRVHVTVGTGANNLGGAQPVGLPYLTVAIPPGTPPGRYRTASGRLVLFEDSGPPYATHPYDGVLDVDRVTGNPIESGVTSDAVVTVNVGESRLTNKVSRLNPILPNVDSGVAFAANFSGTAPSNQAELARVWQTLAQDVTPAAYRDPQTGALVTFWSSNRQNVGGTLIPGIGGGTNNPTDKYHIFGTAMTWTDPANPPTQPGTDPADYLTGSLGSNPWGWQYQGGSTANLFFFPKYGTKPQWFSQPDAAQWLPNAATISAALGTPISGNGSVAPTDLSYTSPSVITDFHGTNFPRAVFFTGSVGTGPEQRSAIFYAPIDVDKDSGAVRVGAGSIQAVGVVGATRTLDPSTQKYQPRPFLITSGGKYDMTGVDEPLGTLTGEKVIGLGVAWFGGAPGRWGLFVSTVAVDDTFRITDANGWRTIQLPLPDGVASALHPSVYYHQIGLNAENGTKTFSGILETAFTGYSRAGRNPDIYVARYVAMQNDKIADFTSLGFDRRGPQPGSTDVPLEPLLRVAGEPRPVYRSHWAAWYGRRDLKPIVYWFQKPVYQGSGGAPSLTNDYKLVATFTANGLGPNGTYLVEATGRKLNGDTLPGVSVFFDLAAGTVRFTTSNPVAYPAPRSSTYAASGSGAADTQDVIYAAFNPYSLRVTTDDDLSDTQPQIWIDESHEALLTTADQLRTPVDMGVSTTTGLARNPLRIRRDRMWVVWRRGASPEGATRATGLYYNTFRLAVDVGQPINTALGHPTVSVTNLIGGGSVTNFTVDAQAGRVFFTTSNDADRVQITYTDAAGNGQKITGTVGWLAESPGATTTGTVYGTDATNTYTLPQGTWAPPQTVPIASQGNDSQPFLFKDPWSDIPPTDPLYYARSNNSMWLLWASTRPSRTIGSVVSAPTIGVSNANSVDPYYYYGSSLLYAGSASDVYFTTLSPDFNK